MFSYWHGIILETFLCGSFKSSESFIPPRGYFQIWNVLYLQLLSAFTYTLRLLNTLCLQSQLWCLKQRYIMLCQKSSPSKVIRHLITIFRIKTYQINWFAISCNKYILDSKGIFQFVSSLLLWYIFSFWIADFRVKTLK